MIGYIILLLVTALILLRRRRNALRLVVNDRLGTCTNKVTEFRSMGLTKCTVTEDVYETFDSAVQMRNHALCQTNLNYYSRILSLDLKHKAEVYLRFNNSVTEVIKDASDLQCEWYTQALRQGAV